MAKPIIKTLLVEDSASDALIVQEELSQVPGVSFAVTPTQRLATAMDHLEAQNFDVVLLDLSLPDSNGIETFMRVREVAQDIPVVVLSGQADEEFAVRAVQAGAQDYLIKGRLHEQILGRAIRYAIERNRSETALRESELKFRHVVQALPAAVYTCDADGRITLANQAAATLWGHTPTLTRTPWTGTSKMANADGAQVSDGTSPLAEAVRQGLPVRDRELTIERPDGTKRYVMAFSEPTFDAAGTVRGAVSMFVDITDRKQAEEALRMPSRVLESMVEGVYVSDPTGTIIFSNHTSDTMFGYATGTLKGRNVAALGLLPPDENSRFAAVIQNELNRCGSWRGEISSRKADGTTVHTLANITTLELGGRKCAVAVHEDITLKKQLESHLLRAQRVESLGSLAGGIAHDMNNILAPILMAAPLLRTVLTEEKKNRFLQIIETSARRGANLVKQLLYFGRGFEGRRRALGLQKSVTEIEVILHETFPRSIAVTTEVATDAWSISADATQIHQVLLNLCVNARDAMPDGGKLSIQVTNVTLDVTARRISPDAKPGPHVLLAVGDTGTGIPLELQDKIFEPFFTTKAEGQGTGLGLATVNGIIKAHGGFLALTSEADRGTTFHLYFPALAATAPAAAVIADHSTPKGQNETILLVDDEEGIRQITGEILRGHGYRVLTAHDGATGAVLFTQHADEIKVVVTDYDMPLLDGLGLIRMIKSIVPEMKIILCTGSQVGLLTATRTAEIRALGVTDVLSKPFSSADLLATINKLISSPNPTPLCPP